MQNAELLARRSRQPNHPLRNRTAASQKSAPKQAKAYKKNNISTDSIAEVSPAIAGPQRKKNVGF
jgi:hypothetical protein